MSCHLKRQCLCPAAVDASCPFAVLVIRVLVLWELLILRVDVSDPTVFYLLGSFSLLMHAVPQLRRICPGGPAWAGVVLRDVRECPGMGRVVGTGSGAVHHTKG